MVNYIVNEKCWIKTTKNCNINSEENIDIPIKEIGGKYPMILKTAQGTQGLELFLLTQDKHYLELCN